MSKENYTFDDIDDILAEFYSSNETTAQPVSAPKAEAAEPRPVIRERKPEPKAENKRPSNKKPAEPKAPAKAEHGKRPGSSLAEFEALFGKSGAKESKPKAEKPAKAPAAPKAEKSKKELRAERKQQAKEEKLAKAAEKAQPAPVEPVAAAKEKPAKKLNPLLALLSGLLSLICVSAILGWVVFNVHPASGSVSSVEGNTVLKLSDKLDVYMNNVASDALGELAYIKKIYTLQESDTVAPVPKAENFGRTTDVAVIQDVIKRAAPLLEGQTVSFDPNADFVPDTEFMYYLDDTIMVIAWKEYINERCCTMAEVKIAHGSQLRRKLAEDSYSSSVQYYASDMAKQSNAVIAINGDFYAFRDLGITVYQRKLYRNNPASVDSCFFTADGDMLFSRRGELMGEGETQQFIDENDVVFAIAFGPVLVDNGELQYCESYPIGEINTEYSRSCIGMTDKLHYLLMTINHTPDARPRATINELARYIYSKGVQKAYTLDGGQTAEIVMFGAPINHVDFGFERTVSDIIYFATAIPEEEVR